MNSWKMVKGWLDPRTQAKIEILAPGAESMKRLAELIDVEYLPKMYGGTAPDLYHSKPHTDIVNVSRGGEFATTIQIPAGKTLFVDSYLADGALDVTVSVPSTKSVLASANIKLPENSQNRTERVLLPIAADASNDRTIRVAWKNAATWHTRQLVYSLTISDTLEFPPFDDGLSVKISEVALSEAKISEIAAVIVDK